MKAMLDHISQPWKTRRYLLIASNAIALALVIYCTVVQVDLKGQELLTMMIVANNAAYAISKHRENNGD